LALPVALPAVGLEVAVFYSRVLRRRALAQRSAQPRRLSRAGARPLWRVPYAAQLSRRAEEGPLSGGRQAARRRQGVQPDADATEEAGRQGSEGRLADRNDSRR